MGRGSWLTNRIANPVLRPLLRTPPGRRLGRSLAVLRYTGSRTRRPHELVVQYARRGGTVWVLVSRPDRKTWWHNLRRPADVQLWLAGEHVLARAVAVVGSERPEEARRGLESYLAGVPRAAAALGLGDGRDGAAVEEAVRSLVLVRADLRPEPDEAA